MVNMRSTEINKVIYALSREEIASQLTHQVREGRDSVAQVRQNLPYNKAGAIFYLPLAHQRSKEKGELRTLSEKERKENSSAHHG